MNEQGVAPSAVEPSPSYMAPQRHFEPPRSLNSGILALAGILAVVVGGTIFYYQFSTGPALTGRVALLVSGPVNDIRIYDLAKKSESPYISIPSVGGESTSIISQFGLFAVSPDNHYVAGTMGVATATVIVLRSVGSVNGEVLARIGTNRTVSTLFWSPDSSRLIYAEQLQPTSAEIAAYAKTVSATSTQLYPRPKYRITFVDVKTKNATQYEWFSATPIAVSPVGAEILAQIGDSFLIAVPPLMKTYALGGTKSSTNQSTVTVSPDSTRIAYESEGTLQTVALDWSSHKLSNVGEIKTLPDHFVFNPQNDLLTQKGNSLTSYHEEQGGLVSIGQQKITPSGEAFSILKWYAE